jgi:antitoxin (DNA-binding transcriptional repressor) of toxin-antitoxin stability system
MARYVSAKEFRLRFSEIAEDLRKSGEIVVVKRSKPLFKVVPFEEVPTDLLDRVATIKDRKQLDLQEISRIVHKVRQVR